MNTREILSLPVVVGLVIYSIVLIVVGLQLENELGRRTRDLNTCNQSFAWMKESRDVLLVESKRDQQAITALRDYIADIGGESHGE